LGKEVLLVDGEGVHGGVVWGEQPEGGSSTLAFIPEDRARHLNDEVHLEAWGDQVGVVQ
jgi:hypothetical protein